MATTSHAQAAKVTADSNPSALSYQSPNWSAANLVDGRNQSATDQVALSPTRFAEQAYS